MYPAYINSKKTVKQGRRICKVKAVDNPLCQEIRDVCVSRGLNAEVSWLDLVLGRASGGEF